MITMRPIIVKSSSAKESFTPERCWISETWNSHEDENLSIAHARVEPGITTALHYLEGVNERYLITAGKGLVEVDDLETTEVGKGDVVVIPTGSSQRITNIGETDLVFYCICTPRFKNSCYHDIESE